MPEDANERRRSKGHIRHHSQRHGLAGKSNKSKVGHMARAGSSNELLNEDHLAKSVGRMKLHSRKPTKKAVIQLEHSDSEENSEYSDVDSDDHKEQQTKDETDEQDQPILRTRTPAPQVSNETVVSISDMSTAAALNQSRGFLDDSDFLTRAVGETRNDQELRSIVGQSSMRTQGLLSRQRQLQRRGRSEVAPAPREIKRESRQMEKVFKQYFNCRAVQNPVLQSLARIGPSLHNKDDSSPLARRNKNLTARTLTQIDTGRENEVSFILNKLWTEGWQDPDKTPAATPAGTPGGTPRDSPAGSKRTSPKLRPVEGPRQ